MTEPLFLLSDRALALLKQRFDLPHEILRRYVQETPTRYALPIFSPTGGRRGHVLRVPWPGTALNLSTTEDVKSLTYIEEGAITLSWYRSKRFPVSCGAVLVEDQMSAMRIAHETEYDSVALLGVNLNEEKIAEIQREHKHVIVALDTDATSTAFKHARVWGRAFDSCRVLILQRDIKDMARGEVSALLA
jgi:hypothetical protein